MIKIVAKTCYGISDVSCPLETRVETSDSPIPDTTSQVIAPLITLHLFPCEFVALKPRIFMLRINNVLSGPPFLPSRDACALVALRFSCKIVQFQSFPANRSKFFFKQCNFWFKAPLLLALFRVTSSLITLAGLDTVVLLSAINRACCDGFKVTAGDSSEYRERLSIKVATNCSPIAFRPWDEENTPTVSIDGWWFCLLPNSLLF